MPDESCDSKNLLHVGNFICHFCRTSDEQSTFSCSSAIVLHFSVGSPTSGGPDSVHLRFIVIEISVHYSLIIAYKRMGMNCDLHFGNIMSRFLIFLLIKFYQTFKLYRHSPDDSYHQWHS